MTKTLQMNFSTASGKRMMLTVDEPREELTAQSVGAAMQEIIETGVFEIDKSPLDSVINARIVERSVTELIEG